MAFAGCVLLLLSGCYERTISREGLLSNREGETYEPNSSNKPIPVIDGLLGTTPTPKEDKYGLKKK